MEGQECGRGECKTCKQKDVNKADFFARGVVYQSSSELCYPPGKEKESARRMESGEGTYTGETSRSVFERVKEHYSAMESW